jgi:hypothetical protein
MRPTVPAAARRHCMQPSRAIPLDHASDNGLSLPLRGCGIWRCGAPAILLAAAAKSDSAAATAEPKPAAAEPEPTSPKSKSAAAKPEPAAAAAEPEPAAA